MLRQPLYAPLNLSNGDRVRRLRDLLQQAGYREAPILDLLGTRQLLPAANRLNLNPLWLHKTSGGSLLETLVRLFLLRQPLPLKVFQTLPHGCDWVEVGLVYLQADMVLPALQLVPCGELVLAADWPGEPPGMRYHVMEVGNSSRSLADSTIRRPCRRALDLGTGCGIQALLTAAHSRAVCAVDSNPRAVNLAAFNAALNGLPNVTFSVGDLFEPVRGLEFDLVVGNLPFVISPESQYLFCQNARPADDLCRYVVQTVPTVLAEGGCCQILSDVAHVRGVDLRQRLAEWFTGSGCDVLITYALTVEAAAYAAQWLRELGASDLRSQAERFEAWMAYYDRQRVEAVSLALFTLRKLSKHRNWFHCEEAPAGRAPTGSQLALRLAVRDFLESLPNPQALLDVRLQAGPDLRWWQELVLGTEAWEVVNSHLRVGESDPGEPADTVTLFVVSRCRGDRTLGDILTELAAALKQDREAIAPRLLEQARRLLEQGILLPAVSPSPG